MSNSTSWQPPATNPPRPFSLKKNLQRLLAAAIFLFAAAFLWLLTIGGMSFRREGSAFVFSKKITANELRPDGPYIFYQRDSLEILRVVPDSTGQAGLVKVQKIAYSDTAGTTFLCRTEDGRDSFRFRLRPIKIPEAQWPVPDTALVVSDIEGNFWAFKRLLLANGVMDSAFNWAFGKGHLVLPGDFVDRGTDVAAVHWLIYKLETEAAAAGGGVHYILGNHEEMMLRGDARYARRKYRALAQQRGIFFQNLYGPDTETGRWLRSKNTLERAGGEWLFLHAGISPAVAASGLSVSQINDSVRVVLGAPASVVERQGGSTALLLGSEGPMWYRGFFKDKADTPAATGGQVDTVAAAFGVRHFCVGHTIVDSIQWLHNQRVLAIDLKHPKSEKDGEPACIWLENGAVFQTDGRGRRKRL